MINPSRVSCTLLSVAGRLHSTLSKVTFLKCKYSFSPTVTPRALAVSYPLSCMKMSVGAVSYVLWCSDAHNHQTPSAIVSNTAEIACAVGAVSYARWCSGGACLQHGEDTCTWHKTRAWWQESMLQQLKTVKASKRSVAAARDLQLVGIYLSCVSTRGKVSYKQQSLLLRSRSSLADMIPLSSPSRPFRPPIKVPSPPSSWHRIIVGHRHNGLAVDVSALPRPSPAAVSSSSRYTLQARLRQYVA